MASVGLAAGSSTCAGVGASIVAGAGSAPGDSTAVGASPFAVGTANGDSSAIGVARALAGSVGLAAGDSTTVGYSIAPAPVGRPAFLICTTSSPSRVLYGENASRMNQRVSIEFSAGDGSTQTGVILRYLNNLNYVSVYMTGTGHLIVNEVIAGVGMNLVNTIFLTPGAKCALQAEAIGKRLRWWLGNYPEMEDRPPDGAHFLAGIYDDTFNGWGVMMAGDVPGHQITRFIACEVPGAVMPAPTASIADASGLNLVPVDLSLTTTYPTAGNTIEWEVLPKESADFPEGYRALTDGALLSHTVFVRPGYHYFARARVTQTPWSEYVSVFTGSSSGADWTSKVQQKNNWPTQDYATAGQTLPPRAAYSFPDVLPDYVMEGAAESTATVMTTNIGRSTATTMDRRPRRSFTLKFENRVSQDYQQVIDFFEFARAKAMSWNWTHPITGEAFVLRFNADDYERHDADQASQSISPIASVSFACIEAPPAGSVVSAIPFTLEVDLSILTP